MLNIHHLLPINLETKHETRVGWFLWRKISSIFRRQYLFVDCFQAGSVVRGLNNKHDYKWPSMEETKHQNFQMNISVSSSQTESRDLAGQQAEKLNNFEVELSPSKSYVATDCQCRNNYVLYKYNFPSKGISNIILS